MSKTLIALLAVLAAPSQSPPASAVAVRLALLVDTSESTAPALHQIRTALQGFVDQLPDGVEALLVTTGRRMQVRVKPTTDRDALKKSIGGLLADRGPTPLMDALLEVDERYFRRDVPPSTRPVFLIVTGDGTESSVRTDEKTFNPWLGSLASRGITAHAIVLKSGNGMPEAVGREMARATHGHFEMVGNAALLGDELSIVAKLLVAKK